MPDRYPSELAFVWWLSSCDLFKERIDPETPLSVETESFAVAAAEEFPVCLFPIPGEGVFAIMTGWEQEVKQFDYVIRPYSF